MLCDSTARASLAISKMMVTTKGKTREMLWRKLFKKFQNSFNFFQNQTLHDAVILQCVYLFVFSNLLCEIKNDLLILWKNVLLIEDSNILER